MIAGQLAARGVDVVLGYARSRDEAEQAARSVRAVGPARRDCAGRPLAARGLPGPRQRGGGHVRPARHPAQHGVGVRAPALRRSDAGGLGWDAQRRSPGHVFLRARGRPAHARAGRRPHRQLQRLDRQERPSPVSRLSSVLRREGGRDRAHGSTGARARSRQHSGERHCARTDPALPRR